MLFLDILRCLILFIPIQLFVLYMIYNSLSTFVEYFVYIYL